MSIESGSSLQTFNDCPRKYQYRYEKLLDGKGYSSALGLGSLVHAYTEVWSGKGRADAVAQEFKAIKDRIDPEQWAQLEMDLKKAAGIHSSWLAAWSAEHPFGNDKWEWLYSEQEFTFPVNEDGDLHAGKMDGIIRHKEWDKVFVYEMKTAADREHDSYVHRLGVDRQVTANIYAAQQLGFHVDGILYDIIWKPMIRQKKEETEGELAARFISTMAAVPDHYFQREVMYRKKEDIVEHLADVRAQFDAIDIARSSRFYRNSGACDKFGSLCTFYSACMEGGVELESLFVKRSRKLPELSDAIQRSQDANSENQ